MQANSTSPSVRLSVGAILKSIVNDQLFDWIGKLAFPTGVAQGGIELHLESSIACQS